MTLPPAIQETIDFKKELKSFCIECLYSDEQTMIQQREVGQYLYNLLVKYNYWDVQR